MPTLPIRQKFGPNSIAKEHQDKINKATSFCEEQMEKFFAHLHKNLDSKEATRITDFILNNTYFAGGVFRSYFTDTPVNDVDVFFKTREAANEFKHIFLRNNIFPYGSVSDNGSFSFKLNKIPLSFITVEVGHPELLVEGFDFTFNRHYYSMQDSSFSFDIDTFSKVGVAKNIKKQPLNALSRLFKYQEQGFKIVEDSKQQLLAAVAFDLLPFDKNKSWHNYVNYTQHLINRSVTGINVIPDSTILNITSQHYTSSNIFNKVTNGVAKLKNVAQVPTPSFLLYQNRLYCSSS